MFGSHNKIGRAFSPVCVYTEKKAGRDRGSAAAETTLAWPNARPFWPRIWPFARLHRNEGGLGAAEPRPNLAL